MSKKILALILGVSILAVTACSGNGNDDAKKAPVKQIIPNGEYSGFITTTDQFNINVEISALHAVISIGDERVLGDFNANIATKVDAVNDKLCFQGKIDDPSNTGVKFTKCVLIQDPKTKANSFEAEVEYLTTNGNKSYGEIAFTSN